MYELKVKQHFDAAHQLKSYEGKCNREHGHRWKAEVCLRGTNYARGGKLALLDERNMLVDFRDVKDAMNVVIDQHLDHYQLNESLGEDNPTAEFLAEWFFRQMKARAGKGVKVVSVEIWESPECSVRYTDGTN